MAELVVAKLGNKIIESATVTEKRVRDETGALHTVRTIDGHSKTLGTDLTYVFSRNVAKARRENKQVTGVADRAPTSA